MLRILLETLDEGVNIKDIENSSISLVEYENNKFKIITVNDMSYKENGDKLKASL